MIGFFEKTEKRVSMKLKNALLIGAVTALFGCTTAFAAGFPDVSAGHWAAQSIARADQVGFMKGMEDGTFGMGQNLTRAQFVSLLTRMFGWERVDAETPTFSDASDRNMWYYKDVETAVQHGVAEKGNGTFRPNENITREEIAVMIVRALGYETLAGEAENMGCPFRDVSSNKGYINLAYDMGIISGMGDGTFAPKGTAKREEAAAMMVRCYDKMTSDVDFLHGFYAFSSYSQKELAGEMDAVSFGWGQMQLDGNGVVLNTTTANNNEWNVPAGYEDIVSYLESKGVQKNLNVYMADRNTANTILGSAENRAKAIDAIMFELTVDYRKLGHNPYDGVTIDFEGLSGSKQKQDFVLFLNELKDAMGGIDKKLYVAVQPAMKDGNYFDGYDFKEIGKTADKVIMMAYDYETTAQETNGFTTTPVTPFDEVYYGLKKITDKNSGVEDKTKIVLGLNPSANIMWQLSGGAAQRGPLLSYSDIMAMEQNGGQVTYSEKYRNPYMKYGDEVIWYEDARSIRDKIDLMKMFGINGVSVWRLGLIPAVGTGNDNIWNVLK